MKQIVLLFIFLFFIKISFSQIFINTNDKYKFEGGIEPGGIATFTKDRISFEKNYFSIVQLNPFLGYFPLKKTNLSVGIKGEYLFMKSNLVSLPSLYGIGIYSKYFFPYTLKYRFFKKIRFFNEISFAKVNYIYNRDIPLHEFEQFSFEYPIKEATLKYTDLSINAGVSVNLKKGFYFNIYEQYLKFLGGGDKFMTKFSFSYIYKEKSKDELIQEQNKKLQKKYISNEKEPNQNFLNGFIVGTSLTYIWNSNKKDYPVDENFYEEYTWNINFATTLNKRMIAGIQVLNIFTSGTHVENNNYLIYGIFTQYDFLAKRNKKTALFLEMSINRGDYCTCGHLDPSRKTNLWYHGFGGGIELPIKQISEHLFLDLSFYNYIILNKIKTKYNYTQYIVGLNYHFGKKRK